MTYYIQRLTTFLVPMIAVCFCSCSVLQNSVSVMRRDEQVTPINQACDGIPLGASATTQQIATYNVSLRILLENILRSNKPEDMRGAIIVDGQKIIVDAGSSELLQLNPALFDKIEIINKVDGLNQISHPVVQQGIGIPVVCLQKYRADKASGKKLFPLNGRHLPATAMLDRSVNGDFILRFHHTRNVQSVNMRGRERELAYDLSTPLHRSMGEGFMHDMALRGLLNSDRYLEDTGIYLPDVYDPAKIPVVFVHGLNSDPHIWQNSMNEVLRDPVLRSKYQCWYFLYPTGLPVYASAEKLRRMLYIARDHYDPQHNNPQMQRMVLVGHSMGGLLSRMQTIDSGMNIYDSFFTKPLDQLKLKPLTKKLISEAMIFDHVPFVSRAVFVASPHQGSAVAEIPLVRAFSLLVNPTTSLDAVTLDVRMNASAELNPELWKFSNLGCRSTQTLSPHHPLLKAIKKCPMQVPYHSIIAAQKADEALNETSDGVVAYWSSHVPGAVSEKIEHGSHSCTKLPGVSEEIRRILKLHLKN